MKLLVLRREDNPSYRRLHVLIFANGRMGKAKKTQTSKLTRTGSINFSNTMRLLSLIQTSLRRWNGFVVAVTIPLAYASSWTIQIVTRTYLKSLAILLLERPTRQ